jgi:hypothetical protein
MRAALRDFYLVMKEAGLYAFANPLSSDVLVALKREQERCIAAKGAPDQAGIRQETHEQSRRRPIGIKLRGSDKQSSIWHHKEKE